MDKADVVVIGGGVIGVSAAYYLAQRGFGVTLVEKGEICAGSSYGNAGLIVPSHSIPLAAPGVLAKGLRWLLDPEGPFYLKPRADRELISWLWQFRRACSPAHVGRALPVLRDLGRLSLALYKELGAIEGFDFGFRQNGLLVLFLTAKGYEEGIREAELLGEGGIESKVLDAADVRRIEAAALPSVVGGVLFADDAHLVPDAFVTGLARIVGDLGVRICTATEVLGFRTAGRRITAIETTRGDLPCDEVVLAAGAWSPGIARSLRLTLPIQPAKGYSVTCRRPDQRPGIPLLLSEAKVAVTPLGGMIRFAGTLELAGLDLSINRRRVGAVQRAVRSYLDGTQDLPLLEIWRGLRPCTPDGLPVIGRSAEPENLILATGHATIGMSLGPVTGKLVAQLASGEPPMLDLVPLSPRRFSRR